MDPPETHLAHVAHMWHTCGTHVAHVWHTWCEVIAWDCCGTCAALWHLVALQAQECDNVFIKCIDRINCITQNQHISVSVLCESQCEIMYPSVCVCVLQIAFHAYDMYNISSDLSHFCREGDLARPCAMALPRCQSPWGTQFTKYRDVWHVTQ